jgi:hypothetical protein
MERWIARTGMVVLLAVPPASPAQEGPAMAEFETLIPKATASEGEVHVQRGARWSGEAQLFWKAPAPATLEMAGERLEQVANPPRLDVPFQAPQPGRYQVVVYHTVAPDYGKVRACLNGGGPCADYDGFSARVAVRRFTLQADLPSGAQRIEFSVMGKADASTNYFVGLDCLKLMRLTDRGPQGGPSGSAPAPPATAADLGLVLVPSVDAYRLDLGGRSTDDFRKYVEELKAHMPDGRDVRELLQRVPAPPVVDLALELRNVSDHPVAAVVGGEFELALELRGPGVVELPYPMPFTLEYRTPAQVTLAPGQSHRVALTHLEDGRRGIGRRLYWTEPGEYTLTAKYTSGRTQSGAKTQLTSAPVTLHVTSTAN